MGQNRLGSAAGAPPRRGPGAANAPGRRWGWWGIVFVAAFVASIAAGSALKAGESLYLPDASVAQLRDFYAASRSAVLVQSALQILAAVALYRFGWRLRTALHTKGTRAGAVLGWGTAITAGSLFASVVCGLALLLATQAGDTTVAGLGRAALVLGGAAHLLGAGLLIAAASAVAWRSHRRPRWVFGYGRLVGPLVAASALSILLPPLVRPEPAFRLLAAVWLVGTGIAILRGAFDEVR
ncbi:hypothetical protein GA0070214_1079 [Micromonospora chaiyaphumensis]|uniref:DUF4386 domain-containing protein n=1 Tax=Micromonospora chaiyaphumensis TaxID=307119 RepID=A0A1C4Y004_9ACTN|nr:hypothetical protein GA0070214_1079 [Micromonospora chaiyaphumensis]